MNAKKLLSMLLSAALAVTTLAGCGEGTNYSNEAVKAANEAQSTVVFETDSDLAKSLQDALEDYTQTSDIKTAMVADENLKDLLTSGYQLDVYAAQGEDAEAAAQAIAQQYIVNIVSGKQSEGKIAMILHKGNGYYYAAVLTYRTGGGSGSGGSGGSSSGDGDEDNTVVLTEIKVTKNPKTEYWVGDSFETSGMVITAYYSNNTSKDVTLDCSMSCTGFDDDDNKVFKTAGTYKVVFTYQGKTATVTVNVANLKAESIEVTKQPDNTNYFVGDEFDTAGMEVTVYFNDGSSRVLDNSEYEVVGNSFDKAGNQEVTIRYTDGTGNTVTTTVPVVVAEVKPATVTVSLAENVYEAGEDFDPSTVTVTVKFNNGTTENVKLSDCTYEITTATGKKVTGKDLAAGKYWLSVSYEGITADSVGFAVEEVYITEILAVDGIKESYYVDDKIDLNEVKVEVKYSNGDTDWLPIKDDSRFTVDPTKFTTDGFTKVLIECKQDGYQDLFYSHGVEVKPNTYTVTVNLDGKGKAPETFEVTAGGSHAFDVAPENGWEVTSVTVNNKNATVEFKGNKVTVSNVQGDVTVTVKLTQMEYNVTLKVVGNGTVELNGETYSNGDIIPVKHGEPLEVKATAAENYEFVSIYDGEVTHKKDSVELYITGNVTITVTFEKKAPVLTSIYANPDTINYWSGEKFDKDDLTIYAVYDNDKDTAEEVTDFTVKNAPTGELTAGTYTLTVEYKGETTTVTLNVKAPYVTGIEVTSKQPVVREWRAGGHDDTVFQVWDLKLSWFGQKWSQNYCDDIEITIKYSNGDEEYITPANISKYVEDKSLSANPSGFDLFDCGQDKTVTISYQDESMSKPVTTTLRVNVKLIN